MDRLLQTIFCVFARADQASNPSPLSESPFNREVLWLMSLSNINTPWDLVSPDPKLSALISVLLPVAELSMHLHITRTILTANRIQITHNRFWLIYQLQSKSLPLAQLHVWNYTLTITTVISNCCCPSSLTSVAPTDPAQPQHLPKLPAWATLSLRVTYPRAEWITQTSCRSIHNMRKTRLHVLNAFPANYAREILPFVALHSFPKLLFFAYASITFHQFPVYLWFVDFAGQSLSSHEFWGGRSHNAQARGQSVLDLAR